MKTDSIIEYLNAYNDTPEEIIDLKVDRFDITGEILNVDLNDLTFFPNLKKLTLCNLMISQEDLEIINNIKSLETLKLINCEINSESKINNDSIINLTIDNINIDLNKLTKKYEMLEIKNIIVKNEELKANTLDISKANIEFNILNIKDIDKLIISKSQFNQNKEDFISLIENIHLIVKNDKYDVVEEEYEKSSN